MNIDVMVGPTRWADAADVARRVEHAGFSGMLFTETGQTPWMSIAAAATAAPSLTVSTGIAVAFPISPMVAASIAWELADNTGGRFRFGLGSQVRAHVERRYGAAFEPPGPRLRDYVLAVKDILAAFRGERPLAHDGPYYRLSLLPDQWRPPVHEHGDVKVDISAVGPWMTAMAGEVADGVHVHPLHSMHYLEQRLLPNMLAGAERAGRDPADIDLLIPVFIVPGDTPEERAFLARRARTQIAFYGSTKNYAFQFDDLGFDGTSARLNDRLKAGDIDGMAATITDEMLDVYAIVGRWDEVVDRIVERYAGVAERITSYLTVEDVARNPDRLGAWGEIARAVRDATPA
ncbi:MAG TPA: TIGR03617 family F420-dependent LLM class oxidoreductase [Mycobacterium sp.]|nr:TIGR03617 family F420-dependent LLM class oxidoreductase [Mycobacterium sp.]